MNKDKEIVHLSLSNTVHENDITTNLTYYYGKCTKYSAIFNSI